MKFSKQQKNRFQAFMEAVAKNLKQKKLKKQYKN